MGKRGYLVGIIIILFFAGIVTYGEFTRKPKVTAESYFIKINRLYFAWGFNGNLKIDHNFDVNNRRKFSTVAENVRTLGWDKDYILYTRERVYMKSRPEVFGVIDVKTRQYYEYKKKRTLYARFPDTRRISLKKPEAYKWFNDILNTSRNINVEGFNVPFSRNLDSNGVCNTGN